ncbi:MAG: carboxy terminal-processing peptidase [Verrucomicrobiae bacterium]|nr:carboxy terminal-processing peptidase [Verrucomicrobiae bacterium]
MIARHLKSKFAVILLGCSLSGLAALAAIVPTQEAGQIALLVGKILCTENYRRQMINDEVSQKMLKNYLDSLDYNHLFFLQSDVQEFQKKYGSLLDDDILKADIGAAVEIFNRYIQRVEQRVALVKELLKEKYTFDTDETFLRERDEAPWPADDAKAAKLWRQRIKLELLQERLAGIKTENSAKSAAPKERIIKKKPSEAVETISRRYNRLLHSVKEWDLDTTLQAYLSSLAHVYDPHSEYMPASELETFYINMKLSLQGIGAVLTSEDGYAKVIEIVPGGPADLDKRLKVNDRIAAVGQGNDPMVDIVDMKLSKAVSMIRGPKGTTVRLLVVPASAPDPATRKEIRIVRDEIKRTEQEAKARLLEIKSPKGRPLRLGYINLPLFYADMQQGPRGKSTTHDVAVLIEKLKTGKGIDGLLIDLRRNTGGALNEAVTMTGLFVPSGPVVQVKDVRGRVQVMTCESQGVAYDGPLAVLVDHTSASASEIVAGALQDYGRAVIVGDKNTFGKGTVQKLEDLTPFFSPSRKFETKPGAIKITTQKFYRVSGGSTQYRGVLSDIHLPAILDYSKINESSLKNALPYDEVTPVNFTSLQNVTPYLEKLRVASRQRIASSLEFRFIREDIERLKVHLQDKTISLNENKRLAEMKANQERENFRKKKRIISAQPALKSIEITLQTPENGKPPAAAITKKVLQSAANRLGERTDDGDEMDLEDPSGNAVYEEGLNILADLIDLSAVSPSP